MFQSLWDSLGLGVAETSTTSPERTDGAPAAHHTAQVHIGVDANDAAHVLSGKSQPVAHGQTLAQAWSIALGPSEDEHLLRMLREQKPFHHSRDASKGRSSCRAEHPTSELTGSASEQPHEAVQPQTNVDEINLQHFDVFEEAMDAADFSLLLRADVESVDVAALRRVSWQGCPARYRKMTWMLLSGCLHATTARRATILARKRGEYSASAAQCYGITDWDGVMDAKKMNRDTLGSSSNFGAREARVTSDTAGSAPEVDDQTESQQRGSSHDYFGPRASIDVMSGSKEAAILKQIRKDVPRMSGGVEFLKHPRVQRSIERLLFVWSTRHPACGYVQGMNELLVPFLAVCLADAFVPNCSVAALYSGSTRMLDDLWAAPNATIKWEEEVEADTYWMFSYVLSAVQDNYTARQQGIFTMVLRLEAVIKLADGALHNHLTHDLDVLFTQFAFRWMNCLLLREISPPQALRLWDSYLADESRSWSITHVYVCAALLLRWSAQLLHMDDFVDVLRFLQSPPTQELGPVEWSEVFSEAFLLEQLYHSRVYRIQTADAAER